MKKVLTLTTRAPQIFQEAAKTCTQSNVVHTALPIRRTKRGKICYISRLTSKIERHNADLILIDGMCEPTIRSTLLQLCQNKNVRICKTKFTDYSPEEQAISIETYKDVEGVLFLTNGTPCQA